MATPLTKTGYKIDQSGTDLDKNVNIAVAMKLVEYADLLQQQGSDGFREKAYRKAAKTITSLDQSVASILEREGRDGLIALPGIGVGIAGAIAELIVTKRWAQLERLRGDLVPEKLFQTIPGIGPRLAARFVDEMYLESLEDLEAAIVFENLPIKGLGARRREAITIMLAERLGRHEFGRTRKTRSLPPINFILKVDEMYRDRAASGSLRKIAPSRFNPSRKKWLPIMHARHDDWHFTALFSNSRLAHQLNKTNDWVIVYFEKEGEREGRCTVVTETHGEMEGMRVVRGREEECKEVLVKS